MNRLLRQQVITVIGGKEFRVGSKLSFTSCPKIPMTKKVLCLRPHLSSFPTHESIVYLRKGFIKYLLKYVGGPENWRDRQCHINKDQVAKWAMSQSDAGMNCNFSIV